MEVEDSADFLVNSRSLGIYDLIKKLCENCAEELPPNIKENFSKKLVQKSYEILLKKSSKSNYIAIPNDFTNEDLLNDVYLQICQHKNDIRVKKLLNKFKRLYELQDTAIYENSFAPVLKMIYSVIINQPNSLKRKKHSNFIEVGKDWFDVGSIPKTLQSLKNYFKPKEEVKFFTLPKIPSSMSEGNLHISRPSGLPSSLTFDNIIKEMNMQMKVEKLSYDLDEGFVTPSEEHKEKTPSFEVCSASKIGVKKFDWDWKVVSIPPSKYKRWEKFDLLGREPEYPFISKKIKYQHFVSKAPQVFKKITGKQLLEDMMSLLIGISSETFIYKGENFQLQQGVCTENLTIDDVIDMTKQFIEAGEAFSALNMLSKKKSDDDTITCAFKLALKEYLYNYHKIVNEKMIHREDSAKYITDIESFIEQIIFLKKLLSNFEEMKGFTLLYKLYSYMGNSSHKMFYTLSSLFLYPCVYYFRLIEDWIFHGRWHKDLPIIPSDMNLVRDRQGWEDAYRPIQTDCLWFLPVQDLAYCGKALFLLSLSRKSEGFLNMLKSGQRPKVKLCLKLNELKELEQECKDYYKKSKNTFCSDKEEVLLDLVSCAEYSAKLRAEAYQEIIEEKKINMLDRKRKELMLREEDLMRSAKVKEFKKHEEELENMRVAKEVEELLFKEKQMELEKAKEIYRILKEEEMKEQRNDLRTEWKLKRLQSKKKLEILNNSLKVNKNLSLEDKENSKGVVVTEELDKVENLIPKMLTKFDENQIKYSELQKNRSKMLGSNLAVGDSTATYLLEEKNDKNYPVMEMIKKENDNKNLLDQSSKESTVGLENEKIFHSVSHNEAEKNKKKMLESHFSLATDIETEEKFHHFLVSNIDDENNKNIIENCNGSELKEALEPKISQHLLTLVDNNRDEKTEGDFSTSELNLSVKSEEQIILLEETNKLDDQSEAATQAFHIGLNGVSWFHNCNKHIDGVKDLFNANYKIILPDQSLDYYSLIKGVPDSLKIVINTQVKLVNQALLEMFLSEFGLLVEAEKLKKFFFLEGEYGKRLTSSLCEAIEREKPSTLLTFGKLRDILASASQGEEKISFIVKETPAAFEHTNPLALGCLGISYKFEWPLNIVFTDIALSKYNEVFEYILSLHRVTWHLEKVWLALKFKSSRIKGPEYTQIQLYRHIMYQFVCTLRSYISTTVFENCWQKFFKDVSEVTKFSDLYRRHAVYIKDIIFKCFLNEKSAVIMKKIKSLLKYILVFCQTMRFGEWSISEDGNYKHNNFIKLQNTFFCFLKFARYVIQQIEKLVRVNYQEGLVNLYNAFTINSFYLTKS